MPQHAGNGSALIGRIRAALRSPIGAAVARQFAGLATCLMYHRIATGGAADSRPPFTPNLELFVAEQEFEKQIAYLARNYNCLPLDEAVVLLQRRKLPRRSVIVTFDDGYRDNLLAVPILERYRVPATIYIATGAIARTRTLWWDEHEAALGALSSLELRGQRWDLSTPELKSRAFGDLNRLFKSMQPAAQDELMTTLRSRAGSGPIFRDETILSWEEVRSLDRHPLVTIGAHTVDHHVMTQLSEPELEHQLTASRRELEHQLGHPVEHFAYPFGAVEHAAEREFKAAAGVGFASAVTTRPGHWRPSSRLHALPRIAVDFSDTMDDFDWKVNGGYAATQRPLALASAAKSFLTGALGRPAREAAV